MRFSKLRQKRSNETKTKIFSVPFELPIARKLLNVNAFFQFFQRRNGISKRTQSHFRIDGIQRNFQFALPSSPRVGFTDFYRTLPGVQEFPAPHGNQSATVPAPKSLPKFTVFYRFSGPDLRESHDYFGYQRSAR